MSAGWVLAAILLTTIAADARAVGDCSQKVGSIERDAVLSAPQKDTWIDPPSAPSSDSALEQSLAAEVARFVEADRAAPPAHCQVLFVGSSSIVNWMETLARDMAPMPVINRGFGGSHIEYVNRWFDQIVAPYRPRAIVFYAGENDIDAGKSAARVVADFDEFMARKTRALGSTPVYFIALKPSRLRFAQLPLQSEVNAAIRARAGKRSDLHYIDVVAPMLEHGKPKDIFLPDGLHMNAEGYAIWTGAVRAALLPNTDAEAQRCRRRDDRAATASPAHWLRGSAFPRLGQSGLNTQAVLSSNVTRTFSVPRGR